jgi:hypothetical protein
LSEPTPAVRRLGRRLLERELESAQAALQPDAAALTEAAERATQRLAVPLARLLGAEGYWGLLRRAVHVARVESPLLQELRVPADPSGGLDVLHAALRDADPAVARDALTAVLTHLVWLLVTFIGEGLTRRTLHEAWPDIQLDREALISSEESNT